MFSIPSFLSWNALHSLVVHSPIALLLIAPLCCRWAFSADDESQIHHLYGIHTCCHRDWLHIPNDGNRRSSRGSSGPSTQTPEVNSLLHQQEELAETTEIAFGTLVVLFDTAHAGGRLVHEIGVTARLHRPWQRALSSRHSVSLVPNVIPSRARRIW